MGRTCPTCKRTVDDDVPLCPYDGTPLGTVVMDRLLGVALGGRYLLRSCVGTRGRFRIYSGEEEGSGRGVLVTLTERRYDEQALARFRELAERLTQVDHAYCTRVRDFGMTPDGILYLVEQGDSWNLLSQDLETKGRLPVSVALTLGTQLLEGLDHLHGQGLVHGCLSPEALRLVFDAEGALQLQIPVTEIPCRALDPEQETRARYSGGDEADMVGDIQATSLIVAEMLTGALPSSTGWSAPELRGVSLPDVRLEQLRDILARGIRGAEGSYTTAGEMLRDLQQLTGQARFGRYNLLRQIGQGGMGEVYLARAEGIEGMDLDRLCVIKTIRTGLAQDQTFVERFLAEARVLASLSHGNIVPVYDVGKVGTTFYIAMQYVAGKDVRLILNRAKQLGRRLPVPLALFIAKELANGLAYAHRAAVRGSQGLVHRDVSPHNVLVSYEGEVRLIDFGLVQAATTKAPTAERGVVMGKICYLSPEQAQAQALDRRTDIYSAGLVLFELLTGEPFFNQPTVEQVLAHVGTPRPEPPSARTEGIPPEVDRICLRAMAPDREQRYASAGELRDDLAAELARIAPRTNPEEAGAFVRELFTEHVEEQRTISDLSATLPPLQPNGRPASPQEQSQRGVSLLGHTPSPIHLESSADIGPPGAPAPAPAAAPAAPRRGRVQSTEQVVALDAPILEPVQRGRGALAVAVFAAVVAVTALVVVLWWHGRSVRRARMTQVLPSLAVVALDAGGRPNPAADDQPVDAGLAPDLAAPGGERPRTWRPRRARPRPVAPRSCKLEVVSGPRGAQVVVNGEPLGRLPLKTPLQLPAGKPLRIVIRRQGYRPFRYNLTCSKGETVRVRAGVRAIR